jgi:hypothetical protein
MDKSIFLSYRSYGLSVVPCQGKLSLISWKEYQERIASEEEISSWDTNKNIAVVCGKVSGGLICVDFDVKNGNKYDEWTVLMNKRDEILQKLIIETTPSGGYHVLFRSDTIFSNNKLAINKENACTIETRGEGVLLSGNEGYSEIIRR